MAFTKITLLGAVAALALTTACTSSLQDPNNPNRNAQQSAMVGAGLGALAGLAVGNDANSRREGALLGAIVGGTGGAIYGSILDKQEAELRQSLGSNIGIVNTGNQLIVSMPQDILFATDSATLTGGLQADLFTLASSMNNYPNTRISVIGHTDNTGSAAYNQQLSQRRAQAVTSVLINAGVSASRISAIGRGEDAPVADNLTEAGRAQNRRVEIIITPTQ